MQGSSARLPSASKHGDMPDHVIGNCISSSEMLLKSLVSGRDTCGAPPSRSSWPLKATMAAPLLTPQELTHALFLPSPKGVCSPRSSPWRGGWLTTSSQTCCKMRALTVCVLLCSAVVLTSAVKPGPAMFADWLEEQTTAAAPTSTAKLAAAYDEADYEWGCLREKRVENCRCIGCLDACGLATVALPDPTCAATAPAEQPTCCTTDYGE